MVLDATLPNTQHYKVRIKGKVSVIQGKAKRPPLHFSIVANKKGILRVALDFGHQIYLYIYWERSEYASYIYVDNTHELKRWMKLFYQNFNFPLFRVYCQHLWLKFCKKKKKEKNQSVFLFSSSASSFLINPGSSTSQDCSCTATYLPSPKPSKLDRRGMPGTAGEVKTNL